MRSRTPLLAALLVVLLLALAVPGAAVTDGERDTADEHPYVVAAQFYVEGEGGLTPVHLCSGVLVADDVVVTAAHCTAGIDAVEVRVGVDLFAPEQVLWGTPVTHPEWDDFAEFPRTYDVGVVELAGSADLADYPDVADPSELEALARQRRDDLELTVAGYGNQGVQLTGAPWDPDSVHQEWDGTRHVGAVSLVTLDSALTGDANLQHSGNPGHGGGTCYGDSGGPVLHEGTVVAVSSFFVGNELCRGNNGFAHRLDIDSSQSFLAPFLEG